MLIVDDLAHLSIKLSKALGLLKKDIKWFFIREKEA